MGFDCPLEEVFSFIYKTPVSDGLIEHEFDHVFVGYFDESPVHTPAEITEWRWTPLLSLQKEISENPKQYTYWLKHSLDKILLYLD